MAFSESVKAKIIQILDEEETDLYVLSLYYRNDGDLNYFSEQDRSRIKVILDTLIQDTEKHAGRLKAIIDSGGV